MPGEAKVEQNCLGDIGQARETTFAGKGTSLPGCCLLIERPAPRTYPNDR